MLLKKNGKKRIKWNNCNRTMENMNQQHKKNKAKLTNWQTNKIALFIPINERKWGNLNLMKKYIIYPL